MNKKTATIIAMLSLTACTTNRQTQQTTDTTTTHQKATTMITQIIDSLITSTHITIDSPRLTLTTYQPATAPGTTPPATLTLQARRITAHHNADRTTHTDRRLTDTTYRHTATATLTHTARRTNASPAIHLAIPALIIAAIAAIITLLRHRRHTP